jgi:hypothetical protein
MDRRPDEMHTWIKYARKKKPEVDNMDRFISEWQGWWLGLNPEWHVREGAFVKELEGSLEGMRKPGANGFLMVLVRLKWWWEDKGPMDAWIAAFEDVTWVMSALFGKR